MTGPRRRRLTPAPRASFAFPFVIATSAGVGTLRLIESPNRYRTPGYDAAKAAMPIRAWGGVFVALAVALAVALVFATRHPELRAWRRLLPLRLAGTAMFAAWCLWGALSAISARTSGTSSYAGAVVYGAVAVVVAVAINREQ